MQQRENETIRLDNFVQGTSRSPGVSRAPFSTLSSNNVTVQIPSKSMAVIPKTEDQVVGLHAVPSVEAKESAIFFPETNAIEGESSASDAHSTDLPEGYQNIFAHLVAQYHQNARFESSGSRRQRVNESWNRSRTESRTSAFDGIRSECPRQVRYGRSRSKRMHTASRSRYANSRPPTSTDLAPTESLPPDSSAALNRSTSDGPSVGGNLDQDDPCTCPISYNCSHRHPLQPDCRPLVREWDTWKERADQEAFDRHRAAAPHRERSTTLETLVSIIGIINDFKAEPTVHLRQTQVGRMRTWILQMEDVTLSPEAQQDAATEKVVPAIDHFLAPALAPFRRAGRVPGYIEEELRALGIKWGRGDFDGSIYRGLKVVETFDVNGISKRKCRQPDRGWPFFTSGLYFGNGTLVNGQIFMSRAELQRDGVHAPSIAGISGTAKRGAYSIVLGEFDEKKNMGYADIDMGDVIEYMGTALKDEENDPPAPTNVQDERLDDSNPLTHQSGRKPTIGTRAMMKSFETGEPVRVIRSRKMCKAVSNKPTKGYRYDGLYRVVGMTTLREERQIWSFRLERLPDQGRLRGFGVDESQPPSDGYRRGHFSRRR